MNFYRILQQILAAIGVVSPAWESYLTDIITYLQANVTALSVIDAQVASIESDVGVINTKTGTLLTTTTSIDTKLDTSNTTLADILTALGNSSSALLESSWLFTTVGMTQAINQFAGNSGGALISDIITSDAGTSFKAVSTSANDSLAGTGIRTLQVTYLATDNTIKTGTIDMNGTTVAVSAATDVKAILSAVALTVGANYGPTGVVSVTINGASTNYHAGLYMYGPYTAQKPFGVMTRAGTISKVIVQQTSSMDAAPVQIWKRHTNTGGSPGTKVADFTVGQGISSFDVEIAVIPGDCLFVLAPGGSGLKGTISVFI